MNREEYKRKLEEARANGQSQEPSRNKTGSLGKNGLKDGERSSADKPVFRMSRDAERTIIGQNQELIGKVDETRATLQKAVESLAGDADKYLAKLEDKENELGKSWLAIDEKLVELRAQIANFNPNLDLNKEGREYFSRLINLLQTTTQESQYTAALKALEDKARNIAFFLDDARKEAATGYKSIVAETVDKEVKRFEEGLNRVTDMQLARFEQKRKHLADIMEMLANWKWWFLGAVVFVGSITITQVSALVSSVKEQRKAEEVQWDARYWQYFKANNPKSSQKIMEEYAKKTKELGQEESE